MAPPSHSKICLSIHMLQFDIIMSSDDGETAEVQVKAWVNDTLSLS